MAGWRVLQWSARIAAINRTRVCRFVSVRAEARTTLTLSPSEALGALRPFYLAVHPDLFTRFPEEKAANEESLKQLNSYLDAVEGSQRPPPVSLTFYIHPSARKRSGVSTFGRLRTVDVCLNSLSVGSVVYDILQSCDLSSYVNDTIRKKLAEIKIFDEKIGIQTLWQTKPHSPVFNDWEDVFMRRSWSKTGPVYLDGWLKSNLPLSRERLDVSQPIREENSRLIHDLCTSFDLSNIVVGSEWTAATLRGHLHSLQTLLHQESLLASELGPKFTIELGFKSGVDVNGKLYLNCEDTLQQWRQFFISAGQIQVQQTREFEMLEVELLSSLLRGASFERPSDVSIDTYGNWLRYFHQQCRQLPNLRHSDTFEGLVLMLCSPERRLPIISRTGTVHIPVSSPLSPLMDYLRKSSSAASRMKEEHNKQQWMTELALSECKEALKLSDLSRAAVITDTQLCQSCQELERLIFASDDHNTISELLGSLEGHYLCLSTYYSVSADGEIKIPWSFKLSPNQ